MNKKIFAVLLAITIVVSSFMATVPVSAYKPLYLIITDSKDPLYPAALYLEHCYDEVYDVVVIDIEKATIGNGKSRIDLKEEAQNAWKLTEWESLSGMWGWWQYWVWDQADYMTAVIAYNYGTLSDKEYTHDDMRKYLGELFVPWIEENWGTPDYVAIVGETGTSMEFYNEGLLEHEILAPTIVYGEGVASELASSYHGIYDRASLYDYAGEEAYMVCTDVEYFAPSGPILAKMTEDWPAWWISRLEEHEFIRDFGLNFVNLMPTPEIPIILDQALTWYYPTGRIAGRTLDDAIALIDRSIGYDEWAAANTELAGKMLSDDLVPTVAFSNAMGEAVHEAGFEVTHHWLEQTTLANSMSELAEGVGQWYITCHGNWAYYNPHYWETEYGWWPDAEVLFLGCGVRTYWFHDNNYPMGEKTKPIPIMIGAGYPGLGDSGRPWLFINADPLRSIDIMDDEGTWPAFMTQQPWFTPAQWGIIPMPDFDHTVIHIMSCMVGSSEMPISWVNKGAAAVISGIVSQEVCEGGEIVAYFYNALSAGYTAGEALHYAYTKVHTLRWFYVYPVDFWFPEEADYMMTSMFLIGDPALKSYVPTPLPEPKPLNQFPDDHFPANTQKTDGVMRRGLLCIDDKDALELFEAQQKKGKGHT